MRYLRSISKKLQIRAILYVWRHPRWIVIPYNLIAPHRLPVAKVGALTLQAYIHYHQSSVRKCLQKIFLHKHLAFSFTSIEPVSVLLVFILILCRIYTMLRCLRGASQQPVAKRIPLAIKSSTLLKPQRVRHKAWR